MGHPTKTEAVAAAAQALPEVLAQVTKRPGGWKTSGLVGVLCTAVGYAASWVSGVQTSLAAHDKDLAAVRQSVKSQESAIERIDRNIERLTGHVLGDRGEGRGPKEKARDEGQ